jgi:hypothetical protein
MTHTGSNPDRTGGGGLSDQRLEALFDQLTKLLNESLVLSRGGDYDGIEARCTQIGGLLTAADPLLRTASPAMLEHAGRIKDLYETLRLHLASRKDELTGEMRKVSQGKQANRAYHS